MPVGQTPVGHERLARWRRWSACEVSETTRRKGWRMSRAPSVASATSYLILQPFHGVALPTSQACYLRHLASRPCSVGVNIMSQELDKSKVRISLNLWSVKCQNLRQGHHRTHSKDTYLNPRKRIKSLTPPGIKPKSQEGRDSTSDAPRRLTSYRYPGWTTQG